MIGNDDVEWSYVEILANVIDLIILYKKIQFTIIDTAIFS